MSSFSCSQYGSHLPQDLLYSRWFPGCWSWLCYLLYTQLLILRGQNSGVFMKPFHSYAVWLPFVLTKKRYYTTILVEPNTHKILTTHNYACHRHQTCKINYAWQSGDYTESSRLQAFCNQANQHSPYIGTTATTLLTMILGMTPCLSHDTVMSQVLWLILEIWLRAEFAFRHHDRVWLVWQTPYLPLIIPSCKWFVWF